MAVLLVLLLLQDPAAAVDAAMAGLVRVHPEAPLAADDVLYRRLVLDLHGRPADDAEVAAFKADADGRKLAKAVDRLLDDPRFAARWARRLGELLIGDPDRFEVAVAGAKPDASARAAAAFVGWLEGKLTQDRPWTEIVHGMIQARGTVAGDPALAFPLSFHRGRGPDQEFPEGLARRLLGLRLSCARCHDHPFDYWGTDHYWQLSAFRTGQTVRAVDGEFEIQYTPARGLRVPGVGTVEPRFLFGNKPDPTELGMKQLADFITAPATRQLPTALANRVWAWLVGEPLYHPVDDFNKIQPPISGPGLKALTDGFVAGGTSFKPLVRLVCATRAYRTATPEEAAGDFSSFRHVARQHRLNQPYRLARPNDKPLPLRFEAPEAWTRRSKSGLPVWTLPDAEGKAGDARLWLYKRRVADVDLKSWSNRFAGAKFRTEPLEGKFPGTLYEVAGVYSCDPHADGPYPARLLLAALRGETEAWLFELLGPADTVDDWRKEFVERVLKSATP